MQFPLGYYGWRAFKNPNHHEAVAPLGPVEGDQFPPCRLALLQSEKDSRYLSLPVGSRYFSLSDIGGEYILLVMYNEMCALCLKELPRINRLFQLVDADEAVKNRVKIIALGAGSTKRSVAKFRKQKAYGFPLFADEKWKVFKALKKPVLPVLYLLKKSDGDGLLIVSRHQGAMGNPQRFMAHIKRTITPAK